MIVWQSLTFAAHDTVARESLLLAAREVFVLISLVVVLVWIGYVLTRGSRS